MSSSSKEALTGNDLCIVIDRSRAMDSSDYCSDQPAYSWCNEKCWNYQGNEVVAGASLMETLFSATECRIPERAVYSLH